MVPRIVTPEDHELMQRTPSINTSLPPPSTTNQTTAKREKRRPSDYAEIISKHSTRTGHESFYTGVHYRDLARFLTRASLGLNHVTDPSGLFEKRQHDFAVLHDLAYPRGDPRAVTRFNGLDGPQKFFEHAAPQGNAGQLLFLRGYPSPDWINTIGARYRVDPELFRQYLIRAYRTEHFELPDLPTSSLNIVKLTVPSLGLRAALTCDRDLKEAELERHFQSLGQQPDIVGESVVRRLWIHDDQQFSIEQNIMLSVMKRGDSWLAVIMLDNGRDLDEGPHGPWLAPSVLKSKFENVFIPVVHFKPKVWSSDVDDDSRGGQTTSTTRRPCAQSASLLPTEQYGQFLSADLMMRDPFYALHDVFSFCAHAENQFLNALRTKAEAMSTGREDEHHLQTSLENCRYHKVILRTKIEQLHDTLESIRARGNPKWPTISGKNNRPSRSSSLGSLEGTMTGNHFHASRRPTLTNRTHASFASSCNEANDAATKLERDYEGLLRKARDLSTMYSEEIDHIRTSVALIEARKSLDYAQGIGRLSLLAFLFLPLTFTTGIFGMNFREIDKDESIWIWAAVSAPVFGAALILCYWPRISYLLQGYQAKRAEARRQRRASEDF